MYEQVTDKIFTPSSNDLLDMIRRAEAKFMAARERALCERAERAGRLNEQMLRAEREHDCRRYVYAGQKR